MSHDPAPSAIAVIKFTRLTKTGGPLTKRISLVNDAMFSDGSACLMSRGFAERIIAPTLNDFAATIASLETCQAIALGALQPSLPDNVQITTAANLAEMNGAAPPDLISRTSGFIAYEPNSPALALIDIDTKGMPDEVRTHIKTLGGFWNALVTVIPELTETGRVIRRSTSTGIVRTDTNQSLPGSNGMHIYLHVEDGADIERFLRTLHDRCWLHGLGWHMVGAGGQLLDRSLVDRMVYAPERLVFEGAPVLDPPLFQDQSSRQPTVFDAPPLDTRAACPVLTIVENADLRARKNKSGYGLSNARAKSRDHFITKHVISLVAKGLSEPDARRVIERQCEGILRPDVILPWDNEDLAGRTVRDVLADPAKFAGATLADPLEGVEYGRTKAIVMQHPDGTPWIHSFAHGRTIYKLRFDAAAVTKIIEASPAETVVATFTDAATNADLATEETETLRNIVAKKSGITKRTIGKKLKDAEQAAKTAELTQRLQRAAAERLDHRPQLPAPTPDDPWLPQMDAINDVLGSSQAPEPPARDIEGYVCQVRNRRVPDMHALGDTSAAAPEQPLITRLGRAHLAELIEQHIDYHDPAHRSVHLNQQFVDHYLIRDDAALPTIAAITTLPIVLHTGEILSARGLDRKRGVVFRVPANILRAIPDTATDPAIATAMKYLCDEFLADVATDYTGKCTLIAAAATVIERILLPERPAFFVTAGRRGGGKTTVLTMILTAVTGSRPSAAAWSPQDEERRKSLLSYLMEGIPAIVWDNITRGTQISCPHIEKACTASFYSDRKLGASELVAVASSAIHFFTGNNIKPSGDLASRSLQVRIEVDRADPENRAFRHADPVGWTIANRSKILAAIYTILRGNPCRDQPPKTRFKTWWSLVASAIEHAADVHVAHADPIMDEPTATPPHGIDFRAMFLDQESEDEEGGSLAEVLAAIHVWNSGPFLARDLAKMMNERGEYVTDDTKERIATLRDFLFPKVPPVQDVSSKSLGRLLGKHVGNATRDGERTLTLVEHRPNRSKRDASGYSVLVVIPTPT